MMVSIDHKSTLFFFNLGYFHPEALLFSRNLYFAQKLCIWMILTVLPDIGYFFRNMICKVRSRDHTFGTRPLSRDYKAVFYQSSELSVVILPLDFHEHAVNPMRKGRPTFGLPCLHFTSSLVNRESPGPRKPTGCLYYACAGCAK